MISVQNHLQLLSGNKISFVVFLLILVSCGTNKAVTKSGTKDTPIVYDSSKPKSTTTKTPDQVVSPGATTKVKVKVDTIELKYPKTPTPPIVVKAQPQQSNKGGLSLKDSYNIKLLIPLNSDSYSPSEVAQSRFVHFYAGVMRALEKLDDEGIKFNIEVIDTEEGTKPLKEKTSEIINEGTDLVIGPFERDDVKMMAEKCKEKGIPLVSPWQTSTKITNENPYYIQMKPNLKEHFLKLAHSTASEFKKGEVFIVGKNNKETNSWISYFQDAAATSLNVISKDFYTPYYVTDDSLSTGPTAFNRLLKNPKLKAIILPNYSYTDEGFAYSCLRRLMAEKGGKQIIVYGMPMLFESEKIEFEYYHALQMRMVMSDFVDENQSDIRAFRREFLDLYGEIPTQDAIKGYDLMLYIGRNIWKYGVNFQNYLEYEPTTYMQSTYNIKKAKSDDSPTASDPEAFDFYENKHLDIIEFKGTKFHRRN
ncbi:MAG TPA: ABC transporter substrate-binding protein [Saprospiraceae bacterium]|nr:ABC transporter substrate-binding protein [Saprospiraceae bacterium]